MYDDIGRSIIIETEGKKLKISHENNRSHSLDKNFNVIDLKKDTKIQYIIPHENFKPESALIRYILIDHILYDALNLNGYTLTGVSLDCQISHDMANGYLLYKLFRKTFFDSDNFLKYSETSNKILDNFYVNMFFLVNGENASRHSSELIEFVNLNTSLLTFEEVSFLVNSFVYSEQIKVSEKLLFLDYVYSLCEYCTPITDGFRFELAKHFFNFKCYDKSKALLISLNDYKLRELEKFKLLFYSYIGCDQFSDAEFFIVEKINNLYSSNNVKHAEILVSLLKVHLKVNSRERIWLLYQLKNGDFRCLSLSIIFMHVLLNFDVDKEINFLIVVDAFYEHIKGLSEPFLNIDINSVIISLMAEYSIQFRDTKFFDWILNHSVNFENDKFLEAKMFFENYRIDIEV